MLTLYVWVTIVMGNASEPTLLTGPLGLPLW